MSFPSRETYHRISQFTSDEQSDELGLVHEKWIEHYTKLSMAQAANSDGEPLTHLSRVITVLPLDRWTYCHISLSMISGSI